MKEGVCSCICLLLPASLCSAPLSLSLSFLFCLCLVFYSVSCVEEGILSWQHPPAPCPDISAGSSALPLLRGQGLSWPPLTAPTSLSLPWEPPRMERLPWALSHPWPQAQPAAVGMAGLLSDASRQRRVGAEVGAGSPPLLSQPLPGLLHRSGLILIDFFPLLLLPTNTPWLLLFLILLFLPAHGCSACPRAVPALCPACPCQAWCQQLFRDPSSLSQTLFWEFFPCGAMIELFPGNFFPQAWIDGFSTSSSSAGLPGELSIPWNFSIFPESGAPRPLGWVRCLFRALEWFGRI